MSILLAAIEWLDLVQNVGLPITLVLFFVWTTHQREQRLETRISSLEEFQKTVLVDTVKANTESNRNNTTALNDLQRSVKSLDTSVVNLKAKLGAS